MGVHKYFHFWKFYSAMFLLQRREEAGSDVSSIVFSLGDLVDGVGKVFDIFGSDAGHWDAAILCQVDAKVFC